MMPLLDFYHEYIKHCNMFLEYFNVENFKDKVKITAATSIDLNAVFLLNKDFQYLTDIKNSKTCVLNDTSLDVFCELKNDLETIDLNFLLRTFMIGGSVYNLASYDLDGQTNHFFEVKHKNSLTFSNYGDCMGAAFDDALNYKYDLLNMLGYNLEKIFSEMDKVKASLEYVLLVNGYEIKCIEDKKAEVILEKQSSQKYEDIAKYIRTHKECIKSKTALHERLTQVLEYDESKLEIIEKLYDNGFLQKLVKSEDRNNVIVKFFDELAKDDLFTLDSIRYGLSTWCFVFGYKELCEFVFSLDHAGIKESNEDSKLVVLDNYSEAGEKDSFAHKVVSSSSVSELLKYISSFYKTIALGVFEDSKNLDIVKYEPDITVEEVTRFAEGFESFIRFYNHVLNEDISKAEIHYKMDYIELKCKVDVISIDIIQTQLSKEGTLYKYLTFDMDTDRDDIIWNQLKANYKDSDFDKKLSKAHKLAMDHKVETRDAFDYDAWEFMDNLRKCIDSLKYAGTLEKKYRIRIRF